MLSAYEAASLCEAGQISGERCGAYGEEYVCISRSDNGSKKSAVNLHLLVDRS